MIQACESGVEICAGRGPYNHIWTSNRTMYVDVEYHSDLKEQKYKLAVAGQRQQRQRI